MLPSSDAQREMLQQHVPDTWNHPPAVINLIDFWYVNVWLWQSTWYAQKATLFLYFIALQIIEYCSGFRWYQVKVETLLQLHYFAAAFLNLGPMFCYIGWLICEHNVYCRFSPSDQWESKVKVQDVNGNFGLLEAFKKKMHGSADLQGWMNLLIGSGAKTLI